MLFCKAVFIKLLLSRSNRQTPIRDTGQIGFLYLAEVFCKKLGLAMEIMSLKSQSEPCGELIGGGDEDNPPSEQQPWLTTANICFVLPQYIFRSPTTELESTGASFLPQSENPFKIFKSTVCKGKHSHSDSCAMGKLAGAYQHWRPSVSMALSPQTRWDASFSGA